MRLPEEALQPLIDTLPGGVLLVDATDNRIVHANQLSSILLGIPYNELTGQRFFPFLADDPDGRILMQALEQRGMLYNHPCQLRSSSGRPFQVSLLMRRLPQIEQPLLVVSFSDQSENKILGQLLDYERQLLNRTLKLVKTLREEIQQHELEDSVSGVMGIRSLMSSTQIEVGRAHRYGSPLSGLLLRLDSLPQQEGNDANDSTLVHLHQLTSSLCIQSSRESDLIAKREDGALVMILPNTTLDGSKLLALRLLRSLSQLTLVRNGKEEHHTASIGGSCLRQEEHSPKAMLERMDLAVQVAQARGGNQLIMQS